MTCAACDRGTDRQHGRWHTCSASDRYEQDVLRGTPDQCWGWRGTVNAYGYTEVVSQGRKIRGHRLAWTLAHGAIPDNLCVLHKCDNRLCTNPNHLFLGTRTDNAKDRDQKGRHRNGAMARTHCSICGGPFDRIRPDGRRQCVSCQRKRVREWAKRNRRVAC